MWTRQHNIRRLRASFSAHHHLEASNASCFKYVHTTIAPALAVAPQIQTSHIEVVPAECIAGAQNTSQNTLEIRVTSPQKALDLPFDVRQEPKFSRADISDHLPFDPKRCLMYSEAAELKEPPLIQAGHHTRNHALAGTHAASDHNTY